MKKLNVKEHEFVVLKAISLLNSSNKKYRGEKDKCIAYYDALYSLYPDMANELRESGYDSRFNKSSVHQMMDYVTEVQTGHAYMLYNKTKIHD